MFDTEKTQAFFGLAAPFIEKFRQHCESARFDTPEAIAHTLSPLIRFGLWNIPGMQWASGRLLDVDGNPMGRPDVGAHELLHDAIFRSDDASMRYPLLNSDFSRGGITKLLMNVEQSATFYPHPWLDAELLVQAKTCRDQEIDFVELMKQHDGDYRYGEHAPLALAVWAGLAYLVIERLLKMPYLAKRLHWDSQHKYSALSGFSFDTLTAFLAPPEVTAKWTLPTWPDGDRDTWTHFEHFVTMAVDELLPAPEKLPPATGDYRDIPPTSNIYGTGNGNGHKAPPSIATLASAYGQTVVNQGDGDPLRDAFERSQLAPKFERELLQAYGLATPPSQIVVDTVAMVEQLQALGITADKALDAAVQLLRPVPSKDGN